MGNTCFLNSALQCLTYTAPFTNYMLTQEHSRTCEYLPQKAILVLPFVSETLSLFTLLGFEPGFCMMCTMENHIIHVFANTGNVIKPIGVLSKLQSKQSSSLVNTKTKICFRKVPFGRLLHIFCLTNIVAKIQLSVLSLFQCTQRSQSTSSMGNKRMPMSSCATFWMQCSSPAYLKTCQLFHVQRPKIHIAIPLRKVLHYWLCKKLIWTRHKFDEQNVCYPNINVLYINIS